MFLVHKEPNDGPFAVVEVSTRAEAVKYEPFLLMPDKSSADTLANHLSGHPGWKKKECPICQPLALKAFTDALAALERKP